MAKRFVVAVVAMGSLLLGMGVWAQHSVPVRLDSWDEEAGLDTKAASGDPVAVSGAALRLTPQDSAPFTCDTARLGWLYMQCVDTSTTIFSSIVLCVCQHVVAGVNDVDPPQWTLLHNDSQTCASIAGTCP